MITSNLARAGHPSRVFITQATPEERASGLVSDSVIVTDNLATVLDKAVDRVLGTLSNMSAVDEALRPRSGCNTLDANPIRCINDCRDLSVRFW